MVYLPSVHLLIWYIVDLGYVGNMEAYCFHKLKFNVKP